MCVEVLARAKVTAGMLDHVERRPHMADVYWIGRCMCASVVLYDRAAEGQSRGNRRALDVSVWRLDVCVLCGV